MMLMVFGGMILLSSPRTLLEETGIDPNQILSVGTSAIGSCVLPIDEDGKPLRPGILYGIDTRAMDEIKQLNRDCLNQKILPH